MSGKSSGLLFSIIFAAIAVSGSLVFLGLQFQSTQSSSSQNIDEDIRKGIESFIQEQQDAAEEARKPQELTGDFTDDDPVLGDPNAPVTIVEFSDYQCPYCRSFFEQTLPKIKEKYIDTGKAKLVYRDLPLGFHSDAKPAAVAAECVRKQKGDTLYFAFHDLIFKGQSKLGQGTVQIPAESLVLYAQQLNVDMKDFNDCLVSGVFDDEIQGDIDAATSVGINGTPAFIINGKIISGAQPFGVFESVIDEALSTF